MGEKTDEEDIEEKIKRHKDDETSNFTVSAIGRRVKNPVFVDQKEEYMRDEATANEPPKRVNVQYMICHSHSQQRPYKEDVASELKFDELNDVFERCFFTVGARHAIPSIAEWAGIFGSIES